MYEIKQKLDELIENITNGKLKVDIDSLNSRIEELGKETVKSDFWDNPDEASKINQELSRLSKEVTDWGEIESDVNDLLEITKTIDAEKDPEGVTELRELTDKLEKKWQKLKLSTFLTGKYDKFNAILTIHAGTGGTDAQDFAEMLLRMYLRHAEKKDYEAKVIEKSVAEEAGIKSVTILISGYLSYGYLKNESGVHRLIRLSPFNVKHTRETSFVLVQVMPDIPETEREEIKKDDLKIETFRASTAGGQSVNTTDSAVRITHIPTKLVVSCQNERSQLQNKEHAMKVLYGKLEDLREKEEVENINALKGEKVEMSWGNQIRTYTLHPYTLVKDHRSNYEEKDVHNVLDGDLDGFIESMIK